ncbi:hypothetical protein IWZ00DRAFT_350341 [Phyllosticta capitalensis]
MCLLAGWHWHAPIQLLLASFSLSWIGTFSPIHLLPFSAPGRPMLFFFCFAAPQPTPPRPKAANARSDATTQFTKFPAAAVRMCISDVHHSSEICPAPPPNTLRRSDPTRFDSTRDSSSAKLRDGDKKEPQKKQKTKLSRDHEEDIPSTPGTHVAVLT